MSEKVVVDLENPNNGEEGQVVDGGCEAGGREGTGEGAGEESQRDEDSTPEDKNNDDEEKEEESPYSALEQSCSSGGATQ